MSGLLKPAGTLGIILSCWPAMAAAQEATDSVISEIRAGILYHDAGLFVVPGEWARHRVESAGFDVNLEILFASPDIFQAIWSPRPHIGATVNPRGATSQIYAGVTWNWDLGDRLFFEFSGGGAVHDGQTDGGPAIPAGAIETAGGEKLLGCRMLFRGAIALGLRLTERQSVSLVLDHISNGYFCDPNPGLDTFGLRWGYRF